MLEYELNVLPEIISVLSPLHQLHFQSTSKFWKQGLQNCFFLYATKIWQHQQSSPQKLAKLIYWNAKRLMIINSHPKLEILGWNDACLKKKHKPFATRRNPEVSWLLESSNASGLSLFQHNDRVLSFSGLNMSVFCFSTLNSYKFVRYCMKDNGFLILTAVLFDHF